MTKEVNGRREALVGRKAAPGEQMQHSMEEYVPVMHQKLLAHMGLTRESCFCKREETFAVAQAYFRWKLPSLPVPAAAVLPN